MTGTLVQGANMPLANGPLTMGIQHSDRVRTDMVALLLNGEKVRSDDDFVFFNNPTGEGVRWNAPSLEGGSQRHSIQIDPAQWGADITRLVVALTIDEENSRGKTFGDVEDLQVNLRDNNGNVVATLNLGRPTVQTGFLVAQVYLHNGQLKLKNVAQGYTTGLTGILNDHGIEVAAEEPAVQDAPPVTVAPPAFQNSKPKLGSGTVYDLTKSTAGMSQFDLRKHEVAVVLVKNALDGIVARIVLVVDSSGSMNGLFRKGIVQRSLERVVPIADMLDDDHKMEVWFFADDSVRSETVSLSNMYDYIPRNMQDKLSAGWGNNEPEVMQDIIDWVKANPSEYPTLVLFWSDGGIYMNEEIERLIREALPLPIFWMFLGLGRAKYGILQKLDDLRGREIDGHEVDNTGFQQIDDIEEEEDNWLYDIILREFAKWVTAFMINDRML